MLRLSSLALLVSAIVLYAASAQTGSVLAPVTFSMAVMVELMLGKRVRDHLRERHRLVRIRADRRPASPRR
jgi:hypothetical protein